MCFSCNSETFYIRIKLEKMREWLWGAAVIVTVTSEGLTFKGATRRLSSGINGSDVYLWVSTDVKRNFLCTPVPTLTAAPCQETETSSDITHIPIY